MAIFIPICPANQWASDWGEKVINGAVDQIHKEREQQFSPEQLREMVLKSWLENAYPAGSA